MAQETPKRKKRILPFDEPKNTAYNSASLVTETQFSP